MSQRTVSLATALAERGITLPATPRPVADYVPAVRVGDLVYTSGQLPVEDGALDLVGVVGEDVSVDEAARLARTCTLNAIAAVADLVGLDAIDSIAKVTGYVASTPTFRQQSVVINGASGLIREIFGARGDHARSAVGVASLPLGAPVEVELVVRIRRDESF
jgi:enamine deaminase RidA (YjgF/YER057c/UK114 family)